MDVGGRDGEGVLPTVPPALVMRCLRQHCSLERYCDLGGL